jgi:hypothetical protein
MGDGMTAGTDTAQANTGVVRTYESPVAKRGRALIPWAIGVVAIVAALIAYNAFMR